MHRRDALRLTGMASAATFASMLMTSFASLPARASFVDAPDVVVFCDTALYLPMRRLGALFRARTGVPIRLICAPGPILAAQLARNERDDIVISLVDIVAALAASGLARPQPSAGTWRNRLLIARAHPGAAPVSANLLPALLAKGRLGAPDLGPNAVVDTQALIRALKLEQPLAGRITGEVDTGGVAWLLMHGQVELGLMLTTDARSAGFSPAVDIPDEAYPAIRYQAAFNKHVLSRNAEAFMLFMASGPAHASLTESGLEIET